MLFGGQLDGDVVLLIVLIEVILLFIEEQIVHLLVSHLSLHALCSPGSKVGQLSEGHEGVIR